MEERIVETLYEILRTEMAIDTTNVKPGDLLAPLADTDDWSFIFIPEVEARFGISPENEKWNEVGTLDEVAKLVAKCTSGRQ